MGWKAGMPGSWEALKLVVRSNLEIMVAGQPFGGNIVGILTSLGHGRLFSCILDFLSSSFQALQLPSFHASYHF